MNKSSVATTTIDGCTEIIDAMDFFCLTKEDVLTIYEALGNTNTARYCPSCKRLDGHTDICKFVKSMEILESLLNQKGNQC